MKPAAFRYHRPGSIDEALAMHAAGEDARFIAGGQSLVPMMSLRLAAPSDLIDLNTVAELSGISHTSTHVDIGAMTRQEELAADERLFAQVPSLRAIVESVGHPGTRTRGTIGGSLCHADPSAELPALLLALDAEVLIASAGGQTRRVAVEEFFGGHFETTLGQNEVLTEIRLPTVAGRRMGFREVTLRSNEFAIAGAIVNAHLAEEGTLDSIRVVAFALGDRPARLRQIEAAIIEAEGRSEARSAALLRSVAQQTEQLIDPTEEPHLSAGYRRQLGVAVVRRALEDALAATPESAAR